MKLKRNPGAVAAVIAAITLAAAACSQGDDTASESPSEGSASESNVNSDPVTTIDPGTLTVALSTGDRPSSYLDENDEPAGFAVEVIEHIATSLDLEINWVGAPTDTHIPGVANGTYDTGTIAALVTPERLEQVSFTTPIQFGQAAVVSQADTAYATFGEVTGRLGVNTDALQALAESSAPDAEIIRFEDATGSYTALRAGQVDGIVLGYNPALARQDEDPTLVLSEPLTTGQVGLTVSQDNPDLLAAFNAVLDELAADGTLYRLHVEHFGYDPADDIYEEYEVFSNE